MIVESEPEYVGKEVVVAYLKKCLAFLKVLRQTSGKVKIQSGASHTKREWFTQWHAIAYVVVVPKFEIDNVVRSGMSPTLASPWPQN
jgi:hypothetical protein